MPKWTGTMIALAVKAVSPDPSAPRRGANSSESATGRVVVNLVLEMVLIDELPARTRRMIQFTTQRISAAHSVKTAVERGIPLDAWTEHMETRLPTLGDGLTPSVDEFEHDFVPRCAARARKWPPRLRRYAEALDSATPWNARFPARFGVKRR